VTRLGQPLREVLLERISGVVGAECDSHFRRQGSQTCPPYMGLAPRRTTVA
jgi:hypothetical protein